MISHLLLTFHEHSKYLSDQLNHPDPTKLQRPLQDPFPSSGLHSPLSSPSDPRTPTLIGCRLLKNTMRGEAPRAVDRNPLQSAKTSILTFSSKPSQASGLSCDAAVTGASVGRPPGAANAGPRPCSLSTVHPELRGRAKAAAGRGC